MTETKNIVYLNEVDPVEALEAVEATHADKLIEEGKARLANEKDIEMYFAGLDTGW